MSQHFPAAVLFAIISTLSSGCVAIGTGVFSVTGMDDSGERLVAVGGDYLRPTAAGQQRLAQR